MNNYKDQKFKVERENNPKLVKQTSNYTLPNQHNQRSNKKFSTSINEMQKIVNPPKVHYLNKNQQETLFQNPSNPHPPPIQTNINNKDYYSTGFKSQPFSPIHRTYVKPQNYEQPKKVSHVIRRSFRDAPDFSSGNSFKPHAKPIYIEKKTEISKPTEMIETVIEKSVPVFIKNDDLFFKNEVRDLKAKIAFLENENNNLKNKEKKNTVVEINKEIVTTITDQHELKELEKIIAGLQRDIERLNSVIKDLERVNIKLELENERLGNENEKVKDLMNKNSDLSDKVHQLKQQIVTMNNLNGQKTDISIERLIEENTKLKEKVDGLEERIRKKEDWEEKNKRSQEREFDSLRNQIKEQKRLTEESKRNEDTLRNKLEDNELRSKRVLSDFEEAVEKNKKLNNRIKQLEKLLEDSNESVKVKLDDQQMSLSELYKRQVEDLKREMESVSLLSEEEKTRNSKLTNNINNLQEENRELRKIIDKLQEKNKEGNVAEFVFGEEREVVVGMSPEEINPEHLNNLRKGNNNIKEEYEQTLKSNIKMLEGQLEEAMNKLAKKKSKNKNLKEKLTFNTFRLLAVSSELERLRDNTSTE